jgi:mRNA interferase RelE/StbE
MGAATQVAARQFDDDFFRLPAHVRERVQLKIDAMGLRLAMFPHFRMTGSERCRLRIGDYRVIYRFDVARNEVYLISIGHRREIYRE